MSRIYNFSRDLRNLYSKTGIKAIEDNYLSVYAAVTSSISDSEIIDWIRSPNAKMIKYSDPKVYEALLALTNINESEIKSKFNYWLVKNCITTPETKKDKLATNYANLLSYFMVFGELLSNDDTNLILRPFSGIVQYFNQPEIKTQCKLDDVSPDRFSVFKNVSLAQNSMINQVQMESSKATEAKPETGLETRQEKKQNLYDDIYDWFSEDIAKAALKFGYNGFAGQMEEGGLLGNTEAIREYLEKAGLSDEIYIHRLNIIYEDLVDDLVKHITKPAYLNKYLRRDKHKDLYREIKEYLMETLQFVNAKELLRIRQQRDLQRRVPSRTKKDSYYENREIKGPEIPLPDEAFLDGTFLPMVSKVLMDLHYKLDL